MKRFLLGLLIAPFLCFGQNPKIVFDWISANGIGETPLTWTPIPAPPSFSSTATINVSCCAPTLESGEISPSGRHDLLVQGPFTSTLTPNGLIGTAISPFRYQSLDLNNRTVVGGNTITPGQQIVSTLNNSNYQYHYSYDLTGNTTTTNAGISGHGFNSVASGANFIFQDQVITNTSYAGFLINSSNTTNTYNNATASFIRIFGYPIEGEGFYWGSTITPTGGSYFTGLTSVSNSLVYNKGREAFQFNGHTSVTADKLTGHLSGQALIAGQDNLFQFQNSHGSLTNSIMDSAPVGMNIFSHEFTVENVYIRFVGGSSLSGPVKSIFVGNLLTAYSNPIPPVNNPAGGSPGKITFRNCYIDADVATTEVCWVEDPNVTIEFVDCVFGSNFASLYADHRGASNYSLIGTLTTNGNTVSSSIPHPTYTNFTPTDYNGHGLCITPLYYNLGMGYRNPK